MERDYKALFAEASARILDLERENDALAQDNAELKSRAGHFLEDDEGGYAYCFGSSGGAHDLGLNGQLIITFVDPLGRETRRTYTADDLQKSVA